MRARAARRVALGALALAGAACSIQLEARSSAGVISRDLGIVTRGTCELDPLIDEVGPACSRVIGRVAAGPDLDPELARAAVDDDTCRSFGAGAAPIWVALDFEAPREVSSVLLVPKSEGTATHVIEASDDGVSWRPLIVFTGPLSSEQGYAVLLPEPVTTRWLRVSTTQAAGAVVWREIAPLDCG